MTKTVLPIALIATLILGIIIGLIIPSTTSSNTYEVRHQGDYRFTNPLLECDSNAFSTDQNLTDLRHQLNSLINQLISDHQLNFASVYFRDLNNGPWIGINEHELFSPASLAKVPVLITYLRLSETDPSLLSQELEYVPTPTRDQNIPPTATLIPNQKYTIEELIRRMIIHSDNSAYSLLFNRLTPQQLISVYRDLGVDTSKIEADPSGNSLSVKEYASFFRILYNSSYLNKSNSEKALQLLSNTEYKDGLAAGIPSTITISHKFGERYYPATGERQLHDCGIVYLPQYPYLICVMTRGNNLDNLSSAIRQISTSTYDVIRQRNK